jgi:hypothetical protein
MASGWQATMFGRVLGMLDTVVEVGVGVGGSVAA